MKICIDPGHGRPDPGAVNPGRLPAPSDDVYETDVAYWAAEELAAELERLGFEVLLTREEAAFRTPGERARIANRWRADLFVSVHLNAASRPEARGFEVLYDDRSPRARAFAETVCRRLQADHPEAVCRGVKPDSATPHVHLTVLEATSMPAILVELGFITSAVDLDWITDNLPAIARPLADGIQEYAESAIFGRTQ